MKVLETKNLSKSYGSIKALQNLNLEIEEGTILGLLGPNGSGKTTTLGIILGILKYDAGHFEWFEGQYGEYHRLKIGAILETPNFYPYLNAIDNLAIVSKIKKDNSTNYDDLLKLVELSERKLSKFSTYSLGMKQRLAIAAALIGNPSVLIFDEPTNGLDPQGIAEVRNIIKRIADTGKTVIMASHILDEVEKICSHVGIMRRGSLLASGKIGEILNNAKLAEFGSNDLTQLKFKLSEISGISIVKDNGKFLECTITSDLAAEDINRMLISNGIFLNHLVVKKQRLEDEFLHIIKSQSSAGGQKA